MRLANILVRGLDMAISDRVLAGLIAAVAADLGDDILRIPPVARRVAAGTKDVAGAGGDHVGAPSRYR